jgi:hypothetical protein
MACYRDRFTFDHGTCVHLNGVLHQFLQLVCVCICIPPIVARQRLGKHKSKSKLLYVWWLTANQFVLAPSPLRLMITDLFFN